MNVRTHLIVSLLAVGTGLGCVNLGDVDDSFVLPDPSLSYPDAVAHDAAGVSLDDPDGYTNQTANADDPAEEPLLPYVLRHYRLGPPDRTAGQIGGLTITLEGTGEPVCIAVDPEQTRDDSCDYNDGDVDLFIGRAEDYTGEVGTTIGEFTNTWVDDLGVEHATDNNLCALGTSPTQPVGRSVAESCAIDTEPGVQYIIVLQTFTIPIDDNVMNVAVLAQPGHRGKANCVFPDDGDRYLINGSPEALDESDAAFPDNPYAENRDPCYCPANDAEKQACGFE